MEGTWWVVHLRTRFPVSTHINEDFESFIDVLEVEVVSQGEQGA